MIQFPIEGYTIPFRLDRNDEGGGLIIYIREDIPCNELKILLPIDIKGIFIEFRMRKKQRILFGGCNPKKEHLIFLKSYRTIT